MVIAAVFPIVLPVLIDHGGHQKIAYGTERLLCCIYSCFCDEPEIGSREAILLRTVRRTVRRVDGAQRQAHVRIVNSDKHDAVILGSSIIASTRGSTHELRSGIRMRC